MSRVRVVDAHDLARNMRETFSARDVEYEEHLPFTWPRALQNVGDSLSVAYGSDKWKPKDQDGKRELEDYKHLAESRNRALVRPGVLRDYYHTRRSWPVFGPSVSLVGAPMPKHFAILAAPNPRTGRGGFLEASLLLHVDEDDDGEPVFGSGDDEVVMKLTLEEATLGASYIRWPTKDQPFLFVYDKSGVQMIIVGDELDVERDGIVG